MQTSISRSRIPLRYTPPALGLALSAVFISPVQAAPKQGGIKKAASNTLTFSMTARFSYNDGSGGLPEQVAAANFFIAGQRVRIESEVAGRPMVVLYAPPYAYRLSPAAKTGIRYKAAALPELSAKYFGSSDFLPNPQSIRVSLQKAGAKKTGSAQLAGQAVDIYTVKNFRGKGNNATAWLRKGDALPLRFEIKSPKLNGVASWRNYQRGRALAPALFTVPESYRIIDRTRTAQG
jgi:hypothetical protein